MQNLRPFCEERQPPGGSFFATTQSHSSRPADIASLGRVVNDRALTPMCAYIGCRPWVKMRRAAAGMLLGMIAPASVAAVAWGGEWEVAINGQRLSIETFTSSAAPEVVLRLILARNEAYDRYLVSDGRLLLSGLGPEAHWLAGIEGRPGGSQGYVSALYFNPGQPRQSPGAHAAFNIPEALTPGGAGRKHGGGAGSAAQAGWPAQVLRRFEFGSSAAVGLVAAAAAETVDVAGSVPGVFTELIPPSGGSPLAVSVSIPEQ